MDHAKRAPRVRWLECICATVVLLAASAALTAQTSQYPQEPPDQLVKTVIANEVAGNKNSSVKHMFLSQKKTAKGTQTHLYVETNEAMAGLLIATNGQPLTPEQQQSEDGHLAWLINNPDQLRKKQAREKEDADRSLRIMRALPDAFRYQYDGTQAGTASMGSTGCKLVRLKFTPNPAYAPPSREEQVLTGMEGYLLIDTDAMRLARIDGTLFRDVTFGWGIFGRLNKGGHFMVQQANEDGEWEITEMHLDITGKILLIKPLNMISDEVLTDFQRMPDDLPFAQGVARLKTEEQKMAHGSNPPQQAETKPPR
jgi:hypothetical protein